MKLTPFLGLLIAPLLPAAMAAVLVGFRAKEFDYDTSAVIAFSCIVGGYVAGICIGWPLLQLWKRQRWTGPFAGGALGVVSAACLTLILAVTLTPFRGGASLVRGFFNVLTFTVPIGAIAGLSFWWLSMRDHNDREPLTERET